MQLQEFIDLKRYFTLLEHSPGKMQLRLDPRVLLHPAARVLPNLYNGNPGAGLVSARANPLAGTLVLEYDPGLVASQDLEDFITTGDGVRAAELAPLVARLLSIELDPQ